MKGRERMSQLFNDIGGYDFVLVDCPPSLGHLTDNALLACQNIIIPAEAEDTSIRAIDILFNQIDTLERTSIEPLLNRLSSFQILIIP